MPPPTPGDAVPPVFAPAPLGPLTLRNRIIKAATFEGVTPGGAVSDALVDFHRRVAAGGAALFEDLKTALFPNTEFRSLFAQPADNDGISLCTKNAAPKAKTRIAYLWAYCWWLDYR